MNNGVNICCVCECLEYLEKMYVMLVQEVQGEGVWVEIDFLVNCVCLFFDGKFDVEMCDCLKFNGFCWVFSIEVWQGYINYCMQELVWFFLKGVLV